jgi:hypothetical protein
MGRMWRVIVIASILAGSVWPCQGVGAVLEVRIVPTSFSEKGGRALSLEDSSQHFYVVITNVSDRTVRLWRGSCSWGYSNLSFVVTGENGEHTTAAKKAKGWQKNYADWTLVPPGDHLISEVTLDEETWSNTPIPPRGQHRTVSLRAIYKVPETKEASENDVWVGTESSPEESYTIYR